MKKYLFNFDIIYFLEKMFPSEPTCQIFKSQDLAVFSQINILASAETKVLNNRYTAIDMTLKNTYIY